MALKVQPHRQTYWSTDPFYGDSTIQSAMDRWRFEAITRCIHLVDNTGLEQDPRSNNHDKIGKVPWLVESFSRISQSLYNNGRVCTVDEIMVPYKGRFCNIRQYMKSKPVKWGIKLWALASSKSRYVSNVIIYMGAPTDRQTWEEEADSVGEQAVLTAVRGLEHRGHVIVTDNFFTSPRLAMALMARGFWLTGTVRKTRCGFPSSLAGFTQTNLPPRGTLAVRMHRSRNIAAIC
jgi:hypothetical protein